MENTLRWCSKVKTRVFTLLLSKRFHSIGKGARVTPPFRCANLHQISLGVGAIIHRDCWIHVVGGLGSDESLKLVIGSHAGIGMGATISAAQQIVIEENVLLARNVYIADHAHAYDDVSRAIMHQGISGVSPVLIGRNSWLGQNVVVLPGVTIGEHCVIGANSVVRNSIPAYSVAVGAPARVVKQFNSGVGRWEKL